MMASITPELTTSPRKPLPRTLAEIQKDIVNLLQSILNINDSVGKQRCTIRKASKPSWNGRLRGYKNRRKTTRIEFIKDKYGVGG